MVEGGSEVSITTIRAAVVVAAVYGYFLIFAQFAFVELLRAGGAGHLTEKIALGLMAAAGIAGGFLTAWRGVSARSVRVALFVAAFAGAIAPFANQGGPAFLTAMATGCALGVATVSMSALIPCWCGVAWVGLGTGLGYAVCNLPAVFGQAPSAQAWIGAGFALLGAAAVPGAAEWRSGKTPKAMPVAAAVLVFTALVWMDSAAFFIIQHARELKSGTWGDGMLWRNAAIHLLFALAAGIWLLRGNARLLPWSAWFLLGIAALAVNDESSRSFAGWIYPAAVSLYSTALVAWPGWFSGAHDARTAAWRGAWLFAIAGWFGSANGIGMVQTLNRVPAAFVIGAGIVVTAATFLSGRGKRPSLFAAGVILLAGLAGGMKSAPVKPTAEERGHQVYVSEGCIHCHSQYVRPGSPDEAVWGPPRDLKEVVKGEPVLIGNRRQGPDLMNVGARRSETWLKQHFIDPQALAPGSSMPSYAHLFKDGRGDDLVRYLKVSGVGATADLMAKSATWNPTSAKGSGDGKDLFARHCAACHGPQGRGDGSLARHFLRPPANLTAGPFVWTAAGPDLYLRISRTIKFGIPGTDMPGHELLTDAEVVALKDYVLELRR